MQGKASYKPSRKPEVSLGFYFLGARLNINTLSGVYPSVLKFCNVLLQRKSAKQQAPNRGIRLIIRLA